MKRLFILFILSLISVSCKTNEKEQVDNHNSIICPTQKPPEQKGLVFDEKISSLVPANGLGHVTISDPLEDVDVNKGTDSKDDKGTEMKEFVTVNAIYDLVKTVGDGKEKIQVDNDKISISYDSMTFHIHSPYKTGRLQKWREETGPNIDGVVINFHIQKKAYNGCAVLPQTISGPYYKTHISEILENGNYLFVQAKFGRRFPKDIKQKIWNLIGISSSTLGNKTKK